MARFVLVHGGWHGGWCFRRLAKELTDRGHDVATPDLPCDEIGLTPLDYAQAVGRQPDAIVVGHSLGGFTIPHIEARARVYLAPLPPLARAEIDECFAEGFGGTVRDTLDRSYWPDADTAAARMYPDCSRAQSDWAFARLRPQARLEPAPAPFGEGDVVIATLRDAAVDPGLADSYRPHPRRACDRARLGPLAVLHAAGRARRHAQFAGLTLRGHSGTLAQPSLLPHEGAEALWQGRSLMLTRFHNPSRPGSAKYLDQRVLEEGAYESSV